jgi:hypothetical protein
MQNSEKMRSLCEVMSKVHALADYAWPRNDEGVSPMSREAEHHIMDIQMQASKALGLPEDLPLMTGNPLVDLD